MLDYVITRRSVLGLTLGLAMLPSCSIEATRPEATGPSAPPRAETNNPARTATGKIDPGQADRLKRAMLPLLRVMDHGVPLDRVKVGILDDPDINAANAGNGEFYVTL